MKEGMVTSSTLSMFRLEVTILYVRQVAQRRLSRKDQRPCLPNRKVSLAWSRSYEEVPPRSVDNHLLFSTSNLGYD